MTVLTFSPQISYPENCPLSLQPVVSLYPKPVTERKNQLFFSVGPAEAGCGKGLGKGQKGPFTWPLGPLTPESFPLALQSRHKVRSGTCHGVWNADIYHPSTPTPRHQEIACDKGMEAVFKALHLSIFPAAQQPWSERTCWPSRTKNNLAGSSFLELMV